jgi:hypothetical protein
MKKTSLFFFGIFVSAFLIAQDCSKIKPGSKYKITSYRYFNDEVFQPSFMKMKEEKKDERVAEFNDKVLSGKQASAGGGTYVYDVVSSPEVRGEANLVFSTKIDGKEYRSGVGCKNDTMYFTRILGPNFMVDKGDTMGFGTLGMQVIPNNLKVGDKLKSYEDIGVTFPTTKAYQTTMKKKIGSYSTSTEIITLYKLIPVDVRESTTFTSQSINYAIAEVVAEEEVTIDGQKYKAFKIESQSWTKGKLDKSYESSNAEWQALAEKGDAKVKAKMQKLMIRKGFTNSLGYLVSYRTEWFVPGIGVAKMDIYDNYGNILARSVLESIL